MQWTCIDSHGEAEGHATASRAAERIAAIHRHFVASACADGVVREGCSSQTSECVVVGGSVLDVQARPTAAALQTGTSIPGTIELVPGGVGRNIAQTLAQLGHPPLFVSAVGRDPGGDALVESIRSVGIPLDGVRSCEGVRSAMVSAVFSQSGEIQACVADCTISEDAIDAAWRVHDRVSLYDLCRIRRSEASIASSRLVILDANLSEEALGIASAAAAAARVPTWFEPVSVAKAGRFAAIASNLAYVSPNAGELEAMADALRDRARGGSTGTRSSGTLAGGGAGPDVLPALDYPSAEEAVKGLAADCAALLAAGVGCVVLTLGALGVVLARRGEEGEATFTHFSAPPAKVVSTCGAGDSLVAGSAAALLEGAPVEEAVAFGMAVARRVVQSRENAPKGSWDREQLRRLAREIAATRRGIVWP